MRICCLFIFPLCGWVGGFFPAAVIFRGLGGGEFSHTVRLRSRYGQGKYKKITEFYANYSID